MDRAFTIAYEDAAFEELLMYTTNYTPAEIAERAYLLGPSTAHRDRHR